MTYLEDLRSQGRLDSSGAFSFDCGRAFEALQKHGGNEYLTRLMAVAVTGGATRLHVTSGRRFQLAFDGRRVTREDLAGLDQLVLTDPFLRYLVLGLFAARRDADRVELLSLGPESGLLVRVEGFTLVAEDVSGWGPTGNWVEVLRGRNYIRVGCFEPAEIYAHCPIPVLEGHQLLNKAWDAREALLLIELEGSIGRSVLAPPLHLRGRGPAGTCGYLAVAWRPVEMELCVHGRQHLQRLSSGLGGFVRNDALPLDLAFERLVDGPALADWKSEIEKTAVAIVSEWLSQLTEPLPEQLAARLVESGLIDADEVARTLARIYRVPLVDPHPGLKDLLPGNLAWLNLALPHSQEEGTLLLALADPANLEALRDVQRLTGGPVRPAVASRKALVAALTEAYGPDVSWLEGVAALSTLRPWPAGALPPFVDWEALTAAPPRAEPLPDDELVRLAGTEWEEPELLLNLAPAPRRGWLEILLRDLFRKPGYQFNPDDYKWWDDRPGTLVLNAILAHSLETSLWCLRLESAGPRLQVLVAPDPAGPWTTAVTLPSAAGQAIAAHLGERLKGKPGYTQTVDGKAWRVYAAATGPDVRIRHTPGYVSEPEVVAVGNALLARAPVVVRQGDLTSVAAGGVSLRPAFYLGVVRYLSGHPGVVCSETEMRLER